MAVHAGSPLRTQPKPLRSQESAVGAGRPWASPGWVGCDCSRKGRWPLPFPPCGGGDDSLPRPPGARGRCAWGPTPQGPCPRTRGGGGASWSQQGPLPSPDRRPASCTGGPHVTWFQPLSGIKSFIISALVQAVSRAPGKAGAGVGVYVVTRRRRGRGLTAPWERPGGWGAAFGEAAAG